MQNSIETYKSQAKETISSLQSNVQFLLEHANHDDKQRAKDLYVCCMMILSYQGLYALLCDEKFILYFNKNFTFLLEEGKINDLFKQLTPPYRLSETHSENYQQWSTLAKFSAVLASELERKTRPILAKKDFYDELKSVVFWLSLISFLAIAFVLFLLFFLGVSTAWPSLAALVLAPLASAAIFMVTCSLFLGDLLNTFFNPEYKRIKLITDTIEYRKFKHIETQYFYKSDMVKEMEVILPDTTIATSAKNVLNGEEYLSINQVLPNIRDKFFTSYLKEYDKPQQSGSKQLIS